MGAGAGDGLGTVTFSRSGERTGRRARKSDCPYSPRRPFRTFRADPRLRLRAVRRPGAGPGRETVDRGALAARFYQIRSTPKASNSVSFETIGTPSIRA
jgi:hypothetical protein